MKKLIIDKCENCPFIGRGGSFGNIAYIPNCGKMNGRKLPYTEHASRGMVTARPTEQIPEWCPLEDL